MIIWSTRFLMRVGRRVKICRFMIGDCKTQLSDMTNNVSTKLQVDELYLIALAIDVDPCELLKYVCKDLKLTSDN